MFFSFSGLLLDAQAALDLLMSRTDIDIDKIVVHGRSLGGAVASKLCSHPAYAQRYALDHYLVGMPTSPPF